MDLESSKEITEILRTTNLPNADRFVQEFIQRRSFEKDTSTDFMEAKKKNKKSK